MKARFLRSGRGLSLIELAVVLAIMGVLSAIVVPNVGGFFGAGQEQSYAADTQTLQTAVNGFRTDANNVGNKYPTRANFALAGAAATNCGGSGIGTPSLTCESWIDIDVLVNGSGVIPGGFIQATDSVKSADTSKNEEATNSPSGSYGWYVDTGGIVKSGFGATNLPGFQEVYP